MDICPKNGCTEPVFHHEDFCPEHRHRPEWPRDDDDHGEDDGELIINGGGE